MVEIEPPEPIKCSLGKGFKDSKIQGFGDNLCISCISLTTLQSEIISGLEFEFLNLDYRIGNMDTITGIFDPENRKPKPAILL